MINNISKSIGTFIALQGQVEAQADKIAYGVEIFLGTLIKLILLLCFSLYLGIVKEVATLLFFAGIFRSISGGAHCSSYGRCLITTLFIYLSLGLLITNIKQYLTTQFLIIALFGFLIYLLTIWHFYIPLGCVNRPLNNIHETKKFKGLSLGLILIHFVLAITLSAYIPKLQWFVFASMLGFLWQAFTLTPLGVNFITLLDKLLIFMKGGIKIVEKNV